MKVFVICYDESPRLKYWDFNEKIIREISFNKKTLDLEKYKPDYNFYHNSSEGIIRSRIAVNEGHINIWNRIIKENLEDIIILEDDAVLKMDMENIENIIKYLPKDGITYLGGRITNPKVADMSKKLINKIDIKLGINKVDVEKFKVMRCFAYYIPNKKIAEQIINNSKHSKSKKYKSTMTDNLLMLVKTNINFIYPSLFKQRKNLISQLTPPDSNLEHDNYTNE